MMEHPCPLYTCKLSLLTEALSGWECQLNTSSHEMAQWVKLVDKSKIRDTVRRLVELLVAGDYDGIEEATRGRRLTAEQLRQAVEEYDRELQMPPQAEFHNLDVNEIEGAIPRAAWVLVDLWTVEEGRSDLTLEIRLTETGGELYDIEIDNLHVL
jgi:hypothetical protein